jgi:hypothetical protein
MYLSFYKLCIQVRKVKMSWVALLKKKAALMELSNVDPKNVCQNIIFAIVFSTAKIFRMKMKRNAD